MKKKYIIKGTKLNKLVAALLFLCAFIPLIFFKGVDGTGSLFLMILSIGLFTSKENLMFR